MLKDAEHTTLMIRNRLNQYIEKNKLKSLVIGVSGGIDSAICCALAKPVCDILEIPLIGVSIPIATNKKNEIDRAQLVGDVFCTEFKEINLTSTFDDIVKGFNVIGYCTTDNIDDKIRLGNLKARIRMMYLYNMAHKHKGMVMSTDNYTEWLMGFWTRFGDQGDFGMIQNLWKTEVYDLARYHMDVSILEEELTALFKCIHAVPTDGLGITDSDLDQLGASSYEEVDNVMMDFLEHGERNDCPAYNTPMVQRYINTIGKRNLPYNLKREEIT